MPTRNRPQGPEEEDSRSEYLRGENKRAKKQETSIKQAVPNVTIQTKEGSYEAQLTVDNSNNFPAQKKMEISRYSIS